MRSSYYQCSEQFILLNPPFLFSNIKISVLLVLLNVYKMSSATIWQVKVDWEETDVIVVFCTGMKKRVKAAFREEGLENYQVPADLPIEAIAREVREAQESLQLKVPILYPQPMLIISDFLKILIQSIFGQNMR